MIFTYFASSSHQNSPDTLPLIQLEARALFISVIFFHLIIRDLKISEGNTEYNTEGKSHVPSMAKSSHRRCSVKKRLQHFAIFTGKHLCWILFLIKLQDQACNFNKKRLQHRCFPVNNAKCLSTTILKDIYQRLLLYSFWWTCEQKQGTAKS